MKISKLLLIGLALLAVITMGIVSCQKQVVSESIAQKQIFSQLGKLYSEEDVEKMLNEKSLGISPENAMVMLIFHSNGELYTAQEMNAIAVDWHLGKIQLEEFYTDLETFYNVTKQQTAKPEYALAIPSAEGEDVFVYDAYRLKYQTREELSEAANQKMPFTGSSLLPINWAGYLKEADVLKGKWSSASPCNGVSFGHATIVYKKATGSTYNTPESLLNATTTFDAWSASVPLADQVAQMNGGTYWNNSCRIQRGRLRHTPALTSSEVSYIKSYTLNQDPDPYSVNTTLSNETKWYCSKLVYRAYLYAGKNVGNGAITFVTPDDIANDSDMIGESF